MQKNTLVIVGSGIKFISHLTDETKIHILQANKILYLVNEPAIEEWLKQKNVNSESLYPFYKQHKLRIDNYKLIAEKILAELTKNQLLCVVIYGHPTVFAMPALRAALQAKENGYQVVILPGISAEDCLFSDLMIDPGSGGCQSYEATEFLIKNKKIDTSAHLILWQVATIGILEMPLMTPHKKGVIALQRKLMRYYDSSHKVVVYEAAQYAHFKPIIKYATLSQLTDLHLTSLSTLYIPPKQNNYYDKEMIDELGLDIKDLFKCTNHF